MTEPPQSPTLHIHLLGDLRLSYDDVPVTTVSTPRLQSLLAYLVLHRNAPQPRYHLAFTFWLDSTEAQARTNLRKQVYYLRHALPEADHFLRADAKVLQWRLDAPFTLDVAEFEKAVAQAEEAEKDGHRVALRASLEQAIALYGGDLLPSCYDDWVMAERERLRQQFTGALERLVSLLERQREYQAAIQYAERLLRHDPLHEATYRQLMRLQALGGNRAGALHTYHTCATILQRELAVEPSAATREAYERLFKLDAVSAHPTATLVSAAPLVGRDREWTQLQTVWRTVSGGRPHFVLLNGEAGIGKTRLAEELLVWAGRQGIPTVVARCYASEGGLAYAPLTAWLRADALQGALASLDEVWLSEVARLLPELLVERPELPRPVPLTESWQRQRLFEALARPFSERRQLLLLLDDVQWCEQETLEWLPYLLHGHGSAGPKGEQPARLLVVATMRTEEMLGESRLMPLLRDLRRSEQLTEIDLGPLSEAETFSLAVNVAGKEFDPALAAPLYWGSEGNPLFVVEMARAGHAKSEQWISAHGREKARENLLLPPKVRRVIEARLAQLSPPARELVGLAATVGREFTFDVLAQANGDDEETLVRALDELWGRRIIREQGADAYDFGHDKIREVAYANLSAVRRRFLHRRVAQAMETVYADDLDTVQGQLAAHYEALGQVQQAIDHYRQAAVVSHHLFAHQETVQYLRKAIALLPGDVTVSEQAAELHEQLGDVLVQVGEHKSARDAFARAVTLTRNPIRQARLLGRKADTLRSQQHYEDADKAYQAAIGTLGEQPGDADQTWWQTWITLQLSVLDLFYFEDRLPEMTNLMDVLGIHLPVYGSARQRATFSATLTMVSLRRSRFRPGETELETERQALAWARKTGDQGLIANQEFGLGFILLWSGEVDAALEQLSLALAEAERMGNIPLQDRCLAYLATGYRFKGDMERVRDFTERGLAVAAVEQNEHYQGVACANRAWLCYRENDFEGVVTHGRTALEWWGGKAYPIQWTALFPLLAVALARNEIEKAVNHAAALLLPSQQRLPDELADTLAQVTHVETPRPYLEQALQLAREMGYL